MDVFLTGWSGHDSLDGMSFFSSAPRPLSQNTPRFRQNWVFMGGVFLCLYFTYFIVQGDRSYVRLIGLRMAISRSESEYERLKTDRADLERKVDMLRPGSINRDYLEERARVMLGYRNPGEVDVVDRP